MCWAHLTPRACTHLADMAELSLGPQAPRLLFTVTNDIRRGNFSSAVTEILPCLVACFI